MPQFVGMHVPHPLADVGGLFQLTHISGRKQESLTISEAAHTVL
jgi:hypothetical protein